MSRKSKSRSSSGSDSSGADSSSSTAIERVVEGSLVKRAEVAGGKPRGQSSRSNQGTQRRSGPAAAFERLAIAPIYPAPGKTGFGIAKKEVSVKLQSSGLQFSSYYTRDPFRTFKTEAIIEEYSGCNWGTFQVASPGTADNIAVSLGTRVKTMFNTLVDSINYNGRFTPSNSLASSSDFSGYLVNYSVAFSILWTYLSAFEALEINTSTASFGAGIGGFGNIGHATELWRRLQLRPIPPGIPKFLSEITGIFYSSIEDFAIYAYWNTNASPTVVTDWTLASGAQSVDTLLALAEANIASIESGNAEANLVAQTMAVIYGVPEVLPTPCIHSSPVAFDFHFTRCAVYHVATQFAQPSGNNGGVGATVPILVRKGYETDPCVEYLFSYLRPQFYDSGPNGSNAASSQCGIMSTGTSGQQNFGRFYGPFGNNTIISDGPTFAVINYGNGSFEEVEWWAAFVQSTSGIVTWSSDSRSYDRWTTFYPNAAVLGDQSLILLNKLFFEGVKIKELR